MTDLPTTAALPTVSHRELPITQPRTALLPPAPGRHHWCVVIPASTVPQFDGEGPDAALHGRLVESLWEHGIGCARFDLFPPARQVVAGHPSAFGRQRARAADVLERLHRIDDQAEVTILASGDAVDIAFALEQESAGRPWPTLRGLLLVPPASVDGTAALARQANDLARSVALDERKVIDRPMGVTRRLLRRLGW